MKKWFKSMLVLVCILVLCIGATACGASAQPAPDPNAVELTQEEQQQWFDSAEQFILSMNEAVQTGTSILTEDDPVYGPAFESWENALPDIGEVLSVEGESTEFTKKEGTVRMHVEGSSHDAEVVINMAMGDSYYEITSIVTNVIYSFKELMQQAGLNTLLGMGTTFAVLILLSVIIAIFGKLIGGAGKKKAPVPKEEAPKAVTARQEAPVQEETVEYTDDMALVAVIAAAIAAYEGRQTTDGFVVRSIRKSRRKS